jgi:uncharacterized protein (UPF0276 family)
MKTGVGYRRELRAWIETRPRGVDCLEITAEHFFHHGEDQLSALAEKFPLFVHGLGLSLGTPGRLDKKILEQFSRVVRIARPEWISDHIAFTRTVEADLGHLNPVPPTCEMLQTISDHAREVAEYCGKPMLLENITSHVKLTGDLAETDFLNELCRRAGCKLLLDVTNLLSIVATTLSMRLRGCMRSKRRISSSFTSSAIRGAAVTILTAILHPSRTN